MDLRNLPEQLSAFERIQQRRTLIERELGVDLKSLEPLESVIGEAEKKNCEQMFGVVAVPVGYAGPLNILLSNGQATVAHFPIATTEGALVASINRGCKAISEGGGATIVDTKYHGISRSIAFRAPSSEGVQRLVDAIRNQESAWKKIAESTSSHLKILQYTIDIQKQYVFLTINADTDEAMGMNMITIAAEAIANWMTETVKGITCVTIAGNVDSDKKPSKRTHERGRGFEVTVSATLSTAVIESILKTTPKDMLAVAKAKLEVGSALAHAIGKNLHVANTIAALYLATGQDVAHVVEGSLADTSVEEVATGLKITVRLPAILVGIRGGGTSLPAQAQCLRMLLRNKQGAQGRMQLAELIAGAVLAGEVSLLGAQASQNLASAHKTLAR